VYCVTHDIYIQYNRDREETSRSVNLGTCYIYTCVGAECGREGEDNTFVETATYQ